MNEIIFIPSWQDRLLNFLMRSRVPTLLADVLVALTAMLVTQLTYWVTGQQPLNSLDPNVSVLGFWCLFVLVFSHYDRSISVNAINEFRRSFSVTDNEFAELKYRFLNLPRNVGWITTILGFLLTSLMLRMGVYAGGGGLAHPLPYLVTFAFSVFIYSLTSHVFWYVVHQLRFIANFFSIIEKINLLNIGSLTAFSRYTFRVSLPFIFASILSYLSNVAFTAEPNVAVALFFIVANLAVATAAFVLPLWEMHKRLRQEKEILISENSERLASAYGDLNSRLDTGNVEGLGEIKQAISALFEFRAAIDSASTWPWDTSTIRSFLSALLLPLFLWFLQEVLGRFAGF